MSSQQRTPAAVELRAPHAHEHAAIHDLVERAFRSMVEEGQAGGEPALVVRLRSDGAVTDELVAVDASGALVGHILFSRLVSEPASLAAVALAPVAVAPHMQARGVGGALVRRGLADAFARGEDAVVVLGHAHYYPRFGFSAALAARALRTPYDGAHLMVAERTPGLLLEKLGAEQHERWSIRYPAAFG